MGKATEEKHRAAGEEGRPPTAQFRTEKDDEKAAIAGPFFTYLSQAYTCPAAIRHELMGLEYLPSTGQLLEIPLIN
jgi:hypothetical protein